VDDNVVGAGDGSSWYDAYHSLNDALAVADAGDEIWVAEGVYYPDEGSGQTDNDRSSTFYLANGVAIYGGFAGTEIERSQRDWTTHLTVLSGDIDKNDVTNGSGVVLETDNINGSNAYHVVRSASVNDTAILDGFFITAGQASADSGGGMLNENASPYLSNLYFRGNTAEYGGGMYNLQSNPQLINVGFSNNSATSGGGMQNNSSSPSFYGGFFQENYAGYSGGGMINRDSSAPFVANVRFEGNTARNQGGGMDNRSTSNPSLVNVSFVGNDAGFYGGGVAAEDNSSPIIINTTFAKNHAGYYGGGMINADNAPILKNCIFWGNTADSGGNQIYNASSTPTVVYSLIQGGYAGTGNISSDPKFTRNPDSGDGDWTTPNDNDYGNLALQISSPAIDAGDNYAVPDGIDTDLAGNPRFSDVTDVVDSGNGSPPIVDMGTYEFDPE
jgi:hypothetical protein